MHLPASVRSAPGLRRRGLSALAVAAVVAGTVPALTGTAHAADLPPWTGWSSISKLGSESYTQGLVQRDDNSAVVLYYQYVLVSGARRPVLHAAVRPAGRDTWETPKQLSSAAEERGQATLTLVGGDVVATWTEYPDHREPGDWGKVPTRLVTSTLKNGAWSAPTILVDRDRGHLLTEPDLAAGADGTLALTWQQRKANGTVWSVWAATRTPDGTWSAAAQVSNAAADGDTGAEQPEATVDSDGTPVVAFRQLTETGGSSIRTSTRPAGAAGWTAPAPIADSATVLGAPRLAGGAGRPVALAWTEDLKAENDRLLHTAVLPDTKADWRRAPDLRVGPYPWALPSEPLVEPDGDVTLIWSAPQGDDPDVAVASATLTHADGKWSRVTTLSSSPNWATFQDASVGKDGTIRALWKISEELHQAHFKDGVWSAGTLLWGSQGADDVEGRIAAGPDGQATATWDMGGESEITALRSARTTNAPLTVRSAYVPSQNDRNYGDWRASWQLSRPVYSYTVTLTGADGTFRRTIKGGTTPNPSVAWDGYGDDGTTLTPSGPLKWTLKATSMAGDTSEQTLATGTVTVYNGASALRDMGSASGKPDGTGDALVMTTDGGIRSIFGNRATGAFKGTATGYGWPAGTLPIPVKGPDLSLCNDLLVRNSKGELRRYTANCGSTFTPKTPKTLIGGGWNQYDVLTSPGDVAGGGPAELVARNASTGALYRYARAKDGTFAPRVQIPGSYKGYKKILGAGDLNGDRFGDLILQDKSNRLWRMNGSSKGTFSAPVKLSDSWGSTYNSVVAAGDLNGDGRADLLARDTSGAIWRIPGTGKGTFGSRVKVATGWQIYKGLY
ncbi:FG-GAP-like repeat-containing protein [Streptomyces sp. NPDC006487]|uniref:FG-GAP-like repeat-containing protein n=1 Tax=Streptomyces sp. NPDC006487 TaxID=3364748 RepID=UPI0036901794